MKFFYSCELGIPFSLWVCYVWVCIMIFPVFTDWWFLLFEGWSLTVFTFLSFFFFFFFLQSVYFLLFMVIEFLLSQWWVRDLTKIFSNVWTSNKKNNERKDCVSLNLKDTSRKVLGAQRLKSREVSDHTINTIPNFVGSSSLALSCPGRPSRSAGCYFCGKVGVRNGAWSLVAHLSLISNLFFQAPLCLL